MCVHDCTNMVKFASNKEHMHCLRVYQFAKKNTVTRVDLNWLRKNGHYSTVFDTYSIIIEVFVRRKPGMPTATYRAKSAQDVWY